MFQQDINLHVTPIGGTRHNDGFAVAFEAEPSEKERAIALLSSVGSERFEEAEIITEAIRSIATYLLDKGSARFEIVAGTDEPVHYALASFAPSFWLPGRYIQLVPEHRRQQLQTWIVSIPPDKVWQVSMPQVLGGARGWRRVRDRLLSVPDISSFYQTLLKERKQLPGFDLAKANLMSRYSLLKCTRRWGWQGRDNSVDTQTEVVVVARTIIFEWACAVVREHVVAELNGLLSRVGIRAAFQLQGLLSPSELLSMRDQVVNGELDLSDALDRIYKAR